MISRQKESTLIQHVAETIRRRIAEGVWPDGKKLPGSGKLAAEFGVARGTVDAAVDLLVKDRCLERRPRSGTYVLKRPLRILYVWNEAQAVFDPVHFNEDMAINQLLLHGLFVESRALGMEVASEYSPRKSPEEWETWFRLRAVRDFDGVVVRGGEDPFYAAQGKYRFPCATWTSLHGPRPGCSTVTDDQTGPFEKIVSRLKEKKYARIVIIAANVSIGFSGRSNAAKIGHFRTLAKKGGFLRIEQVDASAIGASFFETLTPRDAVYCAYTDFIPRVWAWCREKGLLPGRDFGLFGYASGMTFSNLYPEVARGQIDFCAIGRQLCRSLRKQILTGETDDVFIEGRFEEGASL